MLETYIRPLYQQLCVNFIAKKLAGTIAPNTITVLAGFIGVLVLPLLWFQLPILAVIVLLISGYADTLDGTLARIGQHTTPMGSVLDIMMDRIVECAVVLGLFLYDSLHRGGWCLLMLVSILLCITSFLIVGVFTQNNSDKSFYYSPGLIERAEAFIFFIAMILLPHYFTELALLFTSLVLWTAYLRIEQFISNERILSAK